MSITKKTEANLKKLGLSGLDSILLYLPTKYRDYRKPLLKIEDDMIGKGAKYFRLKVTNIKINTTTKPARVQLGLTDGYSQWSAMIFGGVKAWESVQPGQFVNISGKPVIKDVYKNLNGVELVPPEYQGKIVPFYKGKPRVITSDSVWNAVTVALATKTKENIEFIEQKLKMSEKDIFAVFDSNIKDFQSFFMALHRPRDAAPLKEALVIAKKMNALYGLKRSLDATVIESNPESVVRYSLEDIKEVLSKMPFEMTKSQKQAIWDITKDLASDKPMKRLLNGDVGYGKTAAYAVPAICAQKVGKNAVIIMPNSILAKQVAEEISDEFGGEVLLITEGAGKSLGKPEGNPIIVGTTAIIHWLEAIKHDYKIDYLVIDEQQKMGSSQKKALIQPGTNVLEGTATAVPKTMALSMFGNSAVSVLSECPVDKNIESYILGHKHKRTGFERLDKVLEDGGQIAVIYPRLDRTSFFRFQIKKEEAELLPEIREKFKSLGFNLIKEREAEDGSLTLKSRINPKNEDLPFEAVVKKLCRSASGIEFFKDDGALETGQVRNIEQALPAWEQRYPGQVCVLHSDMKEAEKENAVRAAKEGRYSIYLASLIIEIGLTIPNLRGMLVLGADKMGASTLHQLRGRLSRKGGDGVFMMMLDKPSSEYSKETIERLKIVRDNLDGFKIAELDMYQRGFGDLTAESGKQSGNIESLFYNIKVKPHELNQFYKSEEAKRLVGSINPSIESGPQHCA